MSNVLDFQEFKERKQAEAKSVIEDFLHDEPVSALQIEDFRKTILKANAKAMMDQVCTKDLPILTLDLDVFDQTERESIKSILKEYLVKYV